MVKVLFVCLGNICRSPLAEGIFSKLVKEAGLAEKISMDSAGIGSWHEGELPDPRTLHVAREHNIALNHRARQVRPKDLFEFNYILSMEPTVHNYLEQMHRSRNAESKLLAMRNFDPEHNGSLEVPDPYTGTEEDFIETYHILDRACLGLLAYIRQEEGL